jgi:hypothetical protein
MRALSIRQPYAEMILRGIKTVEYRSRPTRLTGQRFYIYASKGKGTKGRRHEGIEGCSDVPCLDASCLDALPRGLIVGTAAISHVSNGQPGIYEWHLTNVKRLARPRKPKRMPQPVWFRPF